MKYYVRAGGLTGFVDALREIGVDGRVILRSAAIDEGQLYDPDCHIDYQNFLHAHVLAYEASGRDDLGLILGYKQTVEVLGILGRAIIDAPRLVDVVASLRDSLRFHTTGLVFYTRDEGDEIYMGFRAINPDWPGVDFIMERSMMLGVSLISERVGYSWHPESISFRRPKPKNIETFYDVFGYHIRFGCNANEFVIDRALLESQTYPSNSERFERISAIVKFELGGLPRRLDN